MTISVIVRLQTKNDVDRQGSVYLISLTFFGRTLINASKFLQHFYFDISFLHGHRSLLLKLFYGGKVYKWVNSPYELVGLPY